METALVNRTFCCNTLFSARYAHMPTHPHTQLVSSSYWSADPDSSFSPLSLSLSLPPPPHRRNCDSDGSDGEEDFYYTEIKLNTDAVADGLGILSPASPSAPPSAPQPAPPAPPPQPPGDAHAPYHPHRRQSQEAKGREREREKERESEGVQPSSLWPPANTLTKPGTGEPAV